MRVRYVAFSLALLGACTPEAQIGPVGDTEPFGPMAIGTSHEDIIGTYVVKLVDGAPPTINIEGHEPIITIGTERIHFQSQCIYADWSYEREGESISTRSYNEPGSAMCARALAPDEAAIQDSVNKARTMTQAGERLSLEGGGRRLELQRLPDQAHPER